MNSRLIQTIIISLLLYIGCFAQSDEYYNISIRYMPFTLMTQINFLEDDFYSLKSQKDVSQIKNETITDKDTCIKIAKLLETLKMDSAINDRYGYDLRMRCLMSKNGQPIDSFYIDNHRRIVYNGKIYFKDKSLADLIFNNICRPIYSYAFLFEWKFWPSISQCCFDTVDFKNVYGDDKYQKFKDFRPDLYKQLIKK